MFDDAFALGQLTDPTNAYALTIGIGAWLGTIMLFNVWVLIWPNQKKILGIVEASADEIAKGKRIAFLASRTNTLLSIPLIYNVLSLSKNSFFSYTLITLSYMGIVEGVSVIVIPFEGINKGPKWSLVHLYSSS